MSLSPPPEQYSQVRNAIQEALDKYPPRDHEDVSPRPEKPDSPEALAQYIDHTYLKLDATEDIISSLCAQALKYKFKAVCVRAEWVPLCAQLLEGKDVLVASVVDFHQGTATPADKAAETDSAVRNGARELDLVIDYPALKAGRVEKVFDGIRAVRQAADAAAAAAAQGNVTVCLKCILETSQLERDEIVAACVIAEEAGADFIKTSTGFNGPGANVENVRLMRQVSGSRLGVKASGGVRDVGDFFRMIEAGATRVGMSNGVGMMEDFMNAGAEVTK